MAAMESLWPENGYKLEDKFISACSMKVHTCEVYIDVEYLDLQYDQGRRSV